MKALPNRLRLHTNDHLCFVLRVNCCLTDQQYGDVLKPVGDKEAVAQAWCMLRPGGLLVVGVPNSCATTGHFDFNAHRVYGFERLAFVSENFEKVGYVGDECYTFEHRWTSHDPLLVLRRPLDLTVKAKKLVAEDIARAVIHVWVI